METSIRERERLIGFRVIVVLLVLAAGGVAAGEEPARAPNGAIAGRVRIVGEPPAAEPRAVTIDQHACGEEPVPDPTLVVGEGGALAWAVVELREGPTQPGGPPKEATVTQERCVFKPHVALVARGGKVEWTNPDLTLHNVHATRDKRTVFNLATPANRGFSRTFDAPGPVHVACDVHWWMEGWVYVTDRAAAVSDERGRFGFDGLAPGEYTLAVWHERVGARTISVRVGGDGPTLVDVTIPAEDIRAP